MRVIASSLLAASESASLPSVGYGALFMLVLFMFASMWIGALANRVTRQGSFMKGFFLGNRGLGAWALALTATVQSGGTFMGFPSLVYTHGWIVALWIGGYMVVPLTGFGILGKRLAQLSRRTGAITVPDLFRTRFGSPTLGLVASLFILLYLSFMMFAQFKAGAIVMKLAWPGSGFLALAEDATTAYDIKYYVGLAIFSLTVVGYTLLGGFLAAVWTDLFQSVLMFFGVLILLFASLSQVGSLEHATRTALANTGPGYVYGPGYDDPAVMSDPKHKDPNPAQASGEREPSGSSASQQTSSGRLTPPARPNDSSQTPPRMTYDASRPREFLPLSMALSFFLVWVWSGVGSPASLVRLMASQNTEVIRRSIYLLSVYNLGIYLPLIVICICGRALIPALSSTDEIIPRLAILTTNEWPCSSLVAGLILAAPFGAVMSTVSSYLVVISSGLVRDIYQRFVRPHAKPTELRKAAYATMFGAGVVAVAVNINPVQYLQAFIVFSATGAAATFLIPAAMACYWRRATVPGLLASMLGGALTVLSLYLLGILEITPEQRFGQLTKFRPYYLLDFDPFLWGLLVSGVCGVLVSLCTRPPDEKLVSKMFDVETSKPSEE